jgi:hypothetical protein
MRQPEAFKPIIKIPLAQDPTATEHEKFMLASHKKSVRAQTEAERKEIEDRFVDYFERVYCAEWNGTN